MSIINQVVKGGGTTPTGSISITNNGTYDVTDKATAVVNVPTTAPAHYIEKTVDANGKLIGSTNIINLNGVTDVGDYALYGAYYHSAAISGVVDMSDLTEISGENACDIMFFGCGGITSANLSALTDISGNYACSSMFNYCTGLTSADLSALTTISGEGACSSMFQNCTSITSVDLSALTEISGENACGTMFSSCSGITSANLSALTDISGNNACNSMFSYCTSLATVYIGGTTAITFGSDPFNYMFDGCDQNIDVYAPAANQAEIEAMTDYPNFGGTGTVTWHWRS